MATVSLEHVTKIYPGNITAVDDLTLEVADGELVVLVGPSGCGKTTTLRLIAGLEILSGGTIAIDRTVVNRLPPKDRDVAMLFQNHLLYPHMNAYRNMAFGLEMRRVPRAEIRRRVEAAAEVLGIGDLLRRRPNSLSGGQRQRVALARAMVRRPQLFLLDEPLSNLDARLRDTLRREIRHLHDRSQTTMICVTHDQTEAMTLGDRVVVIRDGRIQQAADPTTLYNRPANRFVAELVGSPAMNFFHGRIERGDAHLVFKAGGFAIPLSERWQAPLNAYLGKPIILGVRPEHIRPADRSAGNCPRIHARLEAVETPGPHSNLHFTTPDGQIVCRIAAGSSLRIGKTIDLAVAVEHLHLFDPVTEKTIG